MKVAQETSGKTGSDLLAACSLLIQLDSSEKNRNRLYNMKLYRRHYVPDEVLFVASSTGKGVKI